MQLSESDGHKTTFTVTEKQLILRRQRIVHWKIIAIDKKGKTVTVLVNENPEPIVLKVNDLFSMEVHMDFTVGNPT